MRTLRAAQFPEDAGPLAHNVRPEIYHEINNFYTATVYQKGAEVVRMLKRLIGAETFRAGMDLYFELYDGHAATVEDFIGCFERVSKRDLSQFMRWYEQAGTPKITVRGAYDPAGKSYRLDIAQSLAPTPGQHVKAPMTMPLALGLVGANGGDMALTSPTRAPTNSLAGCSNSRIPSARSCSETCRSGPPCRSARFLRAGAGRRRPDRGGSHRSLAAR